MENDPGLEKQGGRWLSKGVSDVNIKKLFIDGDGVFSEAADVRTAEGASVDNSTGRGLEKPGQISVGSGSPSRMDQCATSFDF